MSAIAANDSRLSAVLHNPAGAYRTKIVSGTLGNGVQDEHHNAGKHRHADSDPQYLSALSAKRR